MAFKALAPPAHQEGPLTPPHHSTVRGVDEFPISTQVNSSQVLGTSNQTFRLKTVQALRLPDSELPVPQQQPHNK